MSELNKMSELSLLMQNELLKVQLSDERMRARDLEIACHDERRLREIAKQELEKWKTEALRQYPTPEAYDAACKALWATKEELELVRSALKDLYAAYCDHMHSEFDFPGSDWAPERDSDEAAIKARDALASPAAERNDRDQAWTQLKKDVGSERWTVSDSANYRGFFNHGWDAAIQAQPAPVAQSVALSEPDQRCHDCADFGPICPNTGKPCGGLLEPGAQSEEWIKHEVNVAFDPWTGEMEFLPIPDIDQDAQSEKEDAK